MTQADRQQGTTPHTAASSSPTGRRATAPAHAANLDLRFAVFTAWVATQKARAATAPTAKRKQFSDKTAKIYESLWRGWVEWLSANHRLEWSAATPAHVLEFLNGPAPARQDRRTRRPIESERMANYTQQRYWRVLQSVYSHAVATGLIEIGRSPCVELPQRPRVKERSLERRTLRHSTLDLLRNPARLEQFLPVEHEDQWWVLRDRAAVALVAHCGLSSADLRALRGQDLRVGTQVLGVPTGQRALAGVEAGASLPPAVDVPSTKHRRSIPLPPAALACVLPWLAARARLLAQETARGRADRRTREHLQPLLLSREVSEGQKRAAIEPPTIHKLFQRCLSAALRADGAQADAYIPKGPSVVRNSVIAHWALMLPAEEVARLAGVEPRAVRATPSNPQGSSADTQRDARRRAAVAAGTHAHRS